MLTQVNFTFQEVSKLEYYRKGGSQLIHYARSIPLHISSSRHLWQTAGFLGKLPSYGLSWLAYMDHDVGTLWCEIWYEDFESIPTFCSAPAKVDVSLCQLQKFLFSPESTFAKVQERYYSHWFSGIHLRYFGPTWSPKSWKDKIRWVSQSLIHIRIQTELIWSHNIGLTSPG